MGSPGLQTMPDEVDQFNLVTKLVTELGALNENIPRLVDAVNNLTSLLSGKVGIFTILKKQHEQEEVKGKEPPKEQEKEKPANPPTTTTTSENSGKLPELPAEFRNLVLVTKSGKGYVPNGTLTQEEINQVDRELEPHGLKRITFKNGGYAWLKPYPQKKEAV